MSNAVVISKGGKSNPLIGLIDLFKGISRREVWGAFAIDAVQNRYRRSRLGIAWIVISYLLFVLAISIFFGGFSDKHAKEFIAYVAINYAFFSFLIANLTDGCAVFKSAKTWVNSTPLPHTIHVLNSVSRGAFVFGINMIVAVAILLLTGHGFTPVVLLAIPAFIVTLINAVLIQTCLGYVTARYRDLEHLVQSLARILFFVTPILWILAEQPEGSMRRTLATFNPFTHALEIFSTPMLGHPPNINSWIIIGVITGVNFVTMMIVSYVSHRRLPYWL